MTVPIEVPASIPFEDLKAALAHIKTLSVTHVQTDSLHLKVDLTTAYPQDIFEAGGAVLGLLSGVWFEEAGEIDPAAFRGQGSPIPAPG